MSPILMRPTIAAGYLSRGSRSGEHGVGPPRPGCNWEMEARMHIMRRRGWEIAERLVTPEALVVRRRGILTGALALSAGSVAAHSARAADSAPGASVSGAAAQPGAASGALPRPAVHLVPSGRATTSISRAAPSPMKRPPPPITTTTKWTTARASGGRRKRSRSGRGASASRGWWPSRAPSRSTTC